MKYLIYLNEKQANQRSWDEARNRGCPENAATQLWWQVRTNPITRAAAICIPEEDEAGLSVSERALLAPALVNWPDEEESIIAIVPIDMQATANQTWRESFGYTFDVFAEIALSADGTEPATHISATITNTPMAINAMDNVINNLGGNWSRALADNPVAFYDSHGLEVIDD